MKKKGALLISLLSMVLLLLFNTVGYTTSLRFFGPMDYSPISKMNSSYDLDNYKNWYADKTSEWRSEEKLKQAINKNPRDVNAYIELVDRSDLSQTERMGLLNKALLYCQDSARIYAVMGTLSQLGHLYDENNIEKRIAIAREYYQKAIDLAPFEPYYLECMASLDTVSREKYGWKALSLPKSSGANCLPLLFMYERDKNENGLKKLLKQLSEYKPYTVKEAIPIGVIYEYLKDSSNAIKQYEFVLSVETVENQIRRCAVTGIIMNDPPDQLQEFMSRFDFKGKDSNLRSDFTDVLSMKFANQKTDLNILLKCYYQIASANKPSDDEDSINFRLSSIAEIRGKEIFTILEEKVKQSPDDYVWSRMLAFLYDSNRKKDKALPLYLKTYSICSDDSNVILKIADIYKEMKQKDKAIEYYEKLLQLPRATCGYSESLLNLYYEMGKMEKFESCVSTMISRYPDDECMYQTIGDIYQRIGKYDKAEQLFQKAVRKGNDRYNSGKIKLANVYYQQKEYDKAETLYLEMVRDNVSETDSDGGYYKNLCMIYLHRKEYDKAIHLFISLYQKIEKKDELYINDMIPWRIIDLVPGEHRQPMLQSIENELAKLENIKYLLFLKKECLIDWGHRKEAIPVYEKLWEIDSTDKKTGERLNSLYNEFSIKEQDRKITAANIDKKDHFSLVQMAVSYTRSGEIKKANDIITQFAQKAVKDPEAAYDLATYYMMQKEFSQAISILESAIARFPNKDDIFSDTLLECYSMAHQYDKAVKIFEPKVKMDELIGQMTMQTDKLLALYIKANQMDKAVGLVKKVMDKSTEDPLSFVQDIRIPEAIDGSSYIFQDDLVTELEYHLNFTERYLTLKERLVPEISLWEECQNINPRLYEFVHSFSEMTEKPAQLESPQYKEIYENATVLVNAILPILEKRLGKNPGSPLYTCLVEPFYREHMGDNLGKESTLWKNALDKYANDTICINMYSEYLSDLMKYYDQQKSYDQELDAYLELLRINPAFINPITPWKYWFHMNVSPERNEQLKVILRNRLKLSPNNTLIKAMYEER